MYVAGDQMIHVNCLVHGQIGRNHQNHKLANSTRRRSSSNSVKFVSSLTPHPQPLSHWERVAEGEVLRRLHAVAKAG